MPVKEFLAEKFITPEGSSYILFPNGYKGEFLNDITYFKNILLEKQKLRILFDDDDFHNSILNSLEALSLDLNTGVASKDYQTNFFKTSTEQIIDFNNGDQSWDKYKNEFSFNLIQKEGLEGISILKDFMLCSFGSDLILQDGQKVLIPISQKQSKIIKGLEVSFLDKKVESYVITDHNKIPVVCFSLVNLENEIQLQSVAGRSNFKTQTKPEKIPLVMSAVYNIICQLDTPKPLTFTSSKAKVVDMYLKLGCKKSSNRKGFAVWCHT
jgi:hypothetical protein